MTAFESLTTLRFPSTTPRNRLERLLAHFVDVRAGEGAGALVFALNLFFSATQTEQGNARTEPLEGRTPCYCPRFWTIRDGTRAVWDDKAGMVPLPFGKSKHPDPTRPMTTLKTGWRNIKRKAAITGRLA